MDIKLNNCTLSYLNFYVDSIPTSEDGEPVTVDKPMYVYQLSFVDKSVETLIKFTSNSADILPKWVSYHFSTIKNQFSKMEALKNQAESQLKYNITQLQAMFKKIDSSGKGIFLIDSEGKDNNTPRYHIQIQDLIIKDNNKLVYRKRGVYSDNERPMMLSEYRNILEWIPKEKFLRLIKLETYPPNKYPSRMLFELNYSVKNSFITLDSEIKPKDIDINKWYIYVTQVIGSDEKAIKNEVYSLLKDAGCKSSR